MKNEHIMTDQKTLLKALRIAYLFFYFLVLILSISFVLDLYKLEGDFGHLLLCFSILIAGLLLVLFEMKRFGNKNLKARRLLIYTVICSSLFFVTNVILYLSEDDGQWVDDIVEAFVGIDLGDAEFWSMNFLHFYCIQVVFCSAFVSFLNRRSNEEYFDTYLIPDWFVEKLELNNTTKKRLVLVFLFYPLFYVVPLPIVGYAILVFYFLPIILICAFIYVILWIRKGKEIDDKLSSKTNNAQMYCRHCGKRIDEDSAYCRYCGKKL